MIRKFTLRRANVYKKISDTFWIYCVNINKEKKTFFGFYPMEVKATRFSKKHGFEYEEVIPSDYIFEVVRMYSIGKNTYLVALYEGHYYRLDSNITKYVYINTIQARRRVVRYRIR